MIAINPWENPALQKIEISITGRNLTDDGDVFSKIDPKCRVYLKNDNGQWGFIDETETIMNNTNPDFNKSIMLDYYFEKKQFIKFELIDVDEGGKFDPCGQVETSVAQIMGAKNQISIFDLKLPGKQKSRGKLIIRCEAVKQCNEWLLIQANASGLVLSGLCCGTLNPMLAFFRSVKDGTWDKVFETEVLVDNTRPNWKPFDISVQKLANGEHQRLIKMVVFSKNGDNDNYIGEAIFCIDDLVVKEKKEFEITHLRKKKRTGRVIFSKMTINIRPTFIDYLRGGVKLTTMLAIDFTGSNGNPFNVNDPKSLHAIRPGLRNPYQLAIDGVMEILINYDYDQKVAMYGFGAIPKFPNLSNLGVLHCFPCNANIENPYAIGLQEIEKIYQNCILNVTLSGPTYFAPILKEAMKVAYARKQAGSIEYSIMVIMTDGQINDMDETINLVVECSLLPISIIIVGVGDDNFSNMEILDGDQGLRDSSNKPAIRDCVQFVPFNKFLGNREALAHHVLQEVPDQLATYYRLMNIPPNPPVLIDVNKILLSQNTMNPTVGVIISNQQNLPMTNPLVNMNQPMGMPLNVQQAFLPFIQGTITQMGYGQYLNQNQTIYQNQIQLAPK